MKLVVSVGTWDGDGDSGTPVALKAHPSPWIS